MNWIEKIATRSFSTSYPPEDIRSGQREVRAAPGAIISPQFHQPNMPIYPAVDGATAIKRGYVQNAYAQRALTTIATDISALPFRAGPDTARGSDDYDQGCSLAKLLGPAPGSPNTVMSANALWKYSILQYICTGKIAWAYEFAPRTKNIIGLWPLQTQFFHPIAADTGVSYFKTYDYGVKGTKGYHSYKLDEVCYIYRPSLVDVRMPESPLQSAASSLNIMGLLSQFDSSFLRNSAVAPFIAVTPPFANDEDRTSFRDQFSAKFSGPANAGKTLFAEREVEAGDAGGNSVDSIQIVPIGTTQKDAQLGILREYEIEELLVAIGVPMSMLGDSSSRTFNNSSQEEKNYWKGLVKGYIRELQDGVNAQLAPKLGPQVGWFDMTEVEALKPAPLFPNDHDALDLMAANRITVDEWRESKGLPPAADVGLASESAAESVAEDLVTPPLALVPERGGKPVTTTSGPVSYEERTVNGRVEYRGPAAAPAPKALKDQVGKTSGGFRLYNKWETHFDEKTCQACKDNDGKVNVPARSGIGKNGKKWTSSEQHPNCRCTRNWYLQKVMRSDDAPIENRLLVAFRSQLAVELAKKEDELRSKMSTRRGRNVAVTTLYDKEAHAVDLVKNLTPTLSALGYTEQRIAGWSQDITNRVLSGLDSSLSIFANPDGFMTLLEDDMITIGEVESSLLRLYQGGITVDQLISEWS